MTIYASILAGGSGTRLWPLSTKDLPKQFLPLLSDRTMLQATVDRLLPLAPIDKTFIVTFERYREIVHDQLPGLPLANVIAEPVGRGTAASIGLAATFVAAQDPTAVMGSFSSDHVIPDTVGFRRALSFGEGLARAGHLVTLGITPTYAETGYGYIHCGERLAEGPEGLMAYRVSRFVEKPPLATAQQFIASGDYAWNGGITLGRVDRLLAEIHQHVPTVGAVLDHVARGIRTGRVAEALHEAWPALTESVTIDVGVLEKAEDIVVIPIEVGWNDIGSWASMATLYPADAHQNAARHLTGGRHVAIETHDTFVYSTTGRIIATAGVEGLVIVDTGDALLICHKDQVQLVKQITEAL